ncbi:SDR family NAD(P)-dependent oxidoreductase [Marispirochaeta sp.]|uniref:SDR family NAD(P)-dependent oxidoreductase n=1 Tax=Marispirochaeta sp. TaxID=2038653 RepID=UPI0029C756F4|nr:SDR family NAD(P)-dependent oxidoreductase [Marispirochaeta sp.]
MNRKMPAALVTGASSGMGKQIALALLENGNTVYGAARRTEQMKRITEAGGGVDILINNAGYGSYGAVEDVPMEEARRQFEINLFGLARITQLVLPGMRTRGYGKIINIH